MAGVSKSTVSRAINGSGYVSSELREKILRIVRENDYVPDSKAINLSKKKTMTIGLVLPSTSGPFYGEVIRGVEEVLAARKYFTLLTTLDSAKETSKARERYITILREKRTDGIIIFDPEADEETLKNVFKLKIPCVYMGRELSYDIFDTVLVDNFDGSSAMMEHLLKDHGYGRIAFITGPENSDDSTQRLKGYLYALKTNGMPVDKELVCTGDFTMESGKKLFEKLVKLKAEAVFAANDEMALGVIEEMKKHGMVPGKDMAVVGFDDAMWSKFIQPALTTVHQPMYSIGKLAAKIVLDRLDTTEGSRDPMKIILHTKLMIRNSCGCS